MIGVALAIVAATAIGSWSERRFGLRAQQGARRALLGVLYVLLPPIVFFNIARLELTVDIGGGIVLGWVAAASTALCAWAIGSRLLGLDRPTTGALICSAMLVNTGYLGYPMTVVLLGGEALTEAVAYDVLVSAPSLLLGGFAVGAAFGTRAGEGVRQRVRAFFTRNPPLFAAVLGVLAPEALAPDLLVTVSRAAVVSILPIGFWAVGVALAAEAERGTLRVPPRFELTTGVAVGLRLLLAPALLFVLALPLIDLPGPFLLLAAMPTGINALVIAHAYGLNVRTTAAAIAWTTTIVVVVGLVASLA